MPVKQSFDIDSISVRDDDPLLTAEWLAALEGALENVGLERMHCLIEQQNGHARQRRQVLPHSPGQPYFNTIPVDLQPHVPGDLEIERCIWSYTRWNAMAMVVRAGEKSNVGGHIASFASAATLYDVGFNHFRRAPTNGQGVGPGVRAGLGKCREHLDGIATTAVQIPELVIRVIRYQAQERSSCGTLWRDQL
jgi:hypothetical protein